MAFMILDLQVAASQRFSRTHMAAPAKKDLRLSRLMRPLCSRGTVDSVIGVLGSRIYLCAPHPDCTHLTQKSLCLYICFWTPVWPPTVPMQCKGHAMISRLYRHPAAFLTILPAPLICGDVEKQEGFGCKKPRHMTSNGVLCSPSRYSELV
jgi:hypothetical protein